MPKRNRWKKGDWLIVDEESGIERYASQVDYDFRGNLVTRRYADYEHPQDFVKAMADPRPVPFQNPPNRDFDVCNIAPIVVGATDIPAPTNGAAFHIYDLGIGDMEIDCTFIVRPSKD